MCGLVMGLSPIFAIYLFASSGSEIRDSRPMLPAEFTIGDRREEGELADAGALDVGECGERPACIMEEYPAAGRPAWLACKGCKGLAVGCGRKGDNESLVEAGATPVFNLGTDPGPVMGLLVPLAYTL